ncbi:PAS domain-containing protein [Roseobacter sp. EG26]|uniref:PAS domain-containing protein n=1 Tax=Roseobacter sp. EG26 TaxID=3412477 RepID=UPI003CE57E2B
MNVQTAPINDKRKKAYQPVANIIQRDTHLETLTAFDQSRQAAYSEGETRIFNVASGMKVPITFSDPTLPDCPLVFANSAFEHLTGFRSSVLVGSNCRFLQGEDTDRDEIAKIRDAVERCRATEAIIVNYKANGMRFQNLLAIRPIWFFPDRCLLMGCQNEFNFGLRRRQIERSYYSQFENAAQMCMKLRDQEAKARQALVMQAEAVAARIRNCILRQKARL